MKKRVFFLNNSHWSKKTLTEIQFFLDFLLYLSLKCTCDSSGKLTMYASCRFTWLRAWKYNHYHVFSNWIWSYQRKNFFFGKKRLFNVHLICSNKHAGTHYRNIDEKFKMLLLFFQGELFIIKKNFFNESLFSNEIFFRFNFSFD